MLRALVALLTVFTAQTRPHSYHGDASQARGAPHGSGLLRGGLQHFSRFSAAHLAQSTHDLGLSSGTPSASASGMSSFPRAACLQAVPTALWFLAPVGSSCTTWSPLRARGLACPLLRLIGAQVFQFIRLLDSLQLSTRGSFPPPAYTRRLVVFRSAQWTKDQKPTRTWVLRPPSLNPGGQRT